MVTTVLTRLTMLIILQYMQIPNYLYIGIYVHYTSILKKENTC